MIRFVTVVVCLALASAGLTAADKELDRLAEAGVVIEEILAIDDNIPQDLLDKAECVIVIPSMLKIALGIGGSYGRGAMVCRTGPGFDGPWGAPAMYARDGGSVGFTSLQTGGEQYDIQTAALSHVAPATKGEDATKIGIGAGAGAVIGGLLGGGDGAAKGAAIGGGAGTGVVLATKGKEMRLAPGADVTSQLTAPLTVRVRIS